MDQAVRIDQIRIGIDEGIESIHLPVGGFTAGARGRKVRADARKVERWTIHDPFDQVRSIARITAATMHPGVQFQMDMQQKVELHREGLEQVEIGDIVDDQVDLPGSKARVHGIDHGQFTHRHENQDRKTATRGHQLYGFRGGIHGEHVRTARFKCASYPVQSEAVCVGFDHRTDPAVITHDLADYAEIVSNGG
jgi:hypothetical protein